MKGLTVEQRVKDLETMMILTSVSILFYFIFHKSIFILMAFVLLIISLLFKTLSSKLSNLWLGLSKIIANFNTKVILSVVFYFLIVPTGFFYRLFSKHTLRIKKDRNCGSYFHIRDYSFQKGDFENMW